MSPTTLRPDLVSGDLLASHDLLGEPARDLAVLAAYVVSTASFTETVTQSHSTTGAVEPVVESRNSLEAVFQSFVELLKGSLSHA